MSNQHHIRERIELEDRTIIVKDNAAGYFSMFWYTAIRPLIEPIGQIFHEFKIKLALAGAYGLVAWLQGLFEPEQVIGLFQTPTGLVEGLIILVTLDFITGTGRAIFDSKITFSMKKWLKTFYKGTTYICGILAVTVLANMFPNVVSWFQYVFFLLLSAHEVWSILKHLKLTAAARVAISLMRDGSKGSIKISDLLDRIDKKASEESVTSQSHYFGNEDVDIIMKEKPSDV